MSGGENLFSLVLFFSTNFGAAFGLAGAAIVSNIPQISWRRLFVGILTFAAGGALGGVFLSASLKSIDYFEPFLRRLTHGGPLGFFLLMAMALSLLIPCLVGGICYRRLVSAGKDETGETGA